jgi:predicted transcriptional regulator of viral defense system
LHRGGKSNSGRLEQGNIDRAFSCNMRQSNQVARYDDIEIYLLNSKNVGRIGVKDFDLNGVKLRVTDIERTLIDITVRPNYSGGIYEVLHAYEAAKDRVSVNRLMATLKKLDYTYPYHQAIGFYMEQAGYSESVLKLVEKMEIKYDFYLTYKMKEPEYSERWKLYYPRGFEILS